MKLIVNHISKVLKNKKILDDISMELENGKVYGLCGENGSGKTMLLRALSGLIKVDNGHIAIDEMKLGKDISVLPSLGLIIENAGLYPGLTGYENLRYLAGIKNIIGQDEIKNAIRSVGLNPDDRRTYMKYSLGMKQRLLIAQAIMEKPEVLLLDEPTNGLDNQGVELIRKLILRERDRGALIVITSHNKEDIDLLADERFVIEEGKLKKL
jgi:ABC-2 type transport system ATP-binding protein